MSDFTQRVSKEQFIDTAVSMGWVFGKLDTGALNELYDVAANHPEAGNIDGLLDKIMTTDVKTAKAREELANEIRSTAASINEKIDLKLIYSSGLNGHVPQFMIDKQIVKTAFDNAAYNPASPKFNKQAFLDMAEEKGWLAKEDVKFLNKAVDIYLEGKASGNINHDLEEALKEAVKNDLTKLDDYDSEYRKLQVFENLKGKVKGLEEAAEEYINIVSKKADTALNYQRRQAVIDNFEKIGITALAGPELALKLLDACYYSDGSINDELFNILMADDINNDTERRELLNEFSSKLKINAPDINKRDEVIEAIAPVIETLNARVFIDNVGYYAAMKGWKGPVHVYSTIAKLNKNLEQHILEASKGLIPDSDKKISDMLYPNIETYKMLSSARKKIVDTVAEGEAKTAALKEVDEALASIPVQKDIDRMKTLHAESLVRNYDTSNRMERKEYILNLFLDAVKEKDPDFTENSPAMAKLTRAFRNKSMEDYFDKLLGRNNNKYFVLAALNENVSEVANAIVNGPETATDAEIAGFIKPLTDTYKKMEGEKVLYDRARGMMGETGWTCDLEVFYHINKAIDGINDNEAVNDLKHGIYQGTAGDGVGYRLIDGHSVYLATNNMLRKASEVLSTLNTPAAEAAVKYIEESIKRTASFEEEDIKFLEGKDNFVEQAMEKGWQFDAGTLGYIYLASYRIPENSEYRKFMNDILEGENTFLTEYSLKKGDIPGIQTNDMMARIAGFLNESNEVKDPLKTTLNDVLQNAKGKLDLTQDEAVMDGVKFVNTYNRANLDKISKFVDILENGDPDKNISKADIDKIKGIDEFKMALSVVAHSKDPEHVYDQNEKKQIYDMFVNAEKIRKEVFDKNSKEVLAGPGYEFTKMLRDVTEAIGMVKMNEYDKSVKAKFAFTDDDMASRSATGDMMLGLFAKILPVDHGNEIYINLHETWEKLANGYKNKDFTLIDEKELKPKLKEFAVSYLKFEIENYDSYDHDEMITQNAVVALLKKMEVPGADDLSEQLTEKRLNDRCYTEDIKVRVDTNKEIFEIVLQNLENTGNAYFLHSNSDEYNRMVDAVRAITTFEYSPKPEVMDAYEDAMKEVFEASKYYLDMKGLDKASMFHSKSDLRRKIAFLGMEVSNEFLKDPAKEDICDDYIKRGNELRGADKNEKEKVNLDTLLEEEGVGIGKEKLTQMREKTNVKDKNKADDLNMSH